MARCCCRASYTWASRTVQPIVGNLHERRFVALAEPLVRDPVEALRQLRLDDEGLPLAIASRALHDDRKRVWPLHGSERLALRHD